MAAGAEQGEDEGDLLTEKQAAFCREFVVDFNGKQAYIRAGYEAKGAESGASRLLRNAKVQRYLGRLKADAVKRSEVTVDAVISQTARLAFSDIRRIARGSGALERIEDLDDDTAAAIVSVKVTKRPSGEVDSEGRPIYEDVVEYKFADKRGALDMLGKYLSIWDGGGAGPDDTATALAKLAERLPD